MKLVKREIKGLNLFTYYRDDNGYSFLASSIISNDQDSFEFLVNSKRLINSKSFCMESPLHLCAEFNRKDMASLLIKKGAYRDYKNYLGWTPLFQALMSGSYETFRLLLFSKTGYANDFKLKRKIRYDYYLNPYQKDCYGFTIVHYAYLNKDRRYLKDITKLLKLYKISYIIDENVDVRDPSFLKLYDLETFKEKYYELNKDAFEYDFNGKRNRKTNS